MNLLITRHDKIGDFVTTLPLFKAIKTQYPDTTITALVSKVNATFAQDIDFIDDVIVYHADDFWGMVKQIRQKKFDASISGFIDTRLGALLWLSGIKRRIAPATKLAQLFFNARILQRRSRVEETEVAYNLDLGLALFPHLDLNYTRPLISPAAAPHTQSKNSHALGGDLLKSNSLRVVAFHVGSGGSSEGNLLLKDYVCLAKAASQLPHVQVVFTFGPDDAQAKTAVATLLDFNATLLDSTGSLMDFCRFLSTCMLFVSTSTGPMHLAGAVNINTLSFFGNSLFASSKRWATVSDASKQHNIMLPAPYDDACYAQIEKTMREILA